MNKKTVALLMACVLLVGAAIGGTMAWLTSTSGEVTNTFTVGDINITLQEHKVNDDGKTLGSALTSTTAKDGNNYLFVPGDKLPKDPFVTVEKNSEANYLFVKVVVANNSCTDNTVKPVVTSNPIIDFDIADGWTFYPTQNQIGLDKFEDGTYYFYRTVSKSNSDQTFDVIKGEHVTDCDNTDTCECKFANGFVTVDTKVTKGMVNTINGAADADPVTVAKLPTLTFTAHAVQKANIAEEEANKLAAAWNILFGTTTNP